MAIGSSGGDDSRGDARDGRPRCRSRIRRASIGRRVGSVGHGRRASIGRPIGGHRGVAAATLDDRVAADAFRPEAAEAVGRA